MLLSKLCAINFNATTFPGGTAVRSSLAKVPCEIIRDDLPYPQAGCPSTSLAALSFLVICERPVGEYIFDAIIDAGSEYQIDIEGFPVD
jgi:sarcosine oxidase gamma subunit